MKRDYSPGPWRQHKQKSGIILARTRKEVARIGDDDNARLIAAAPELLEALREVVYSWHFEHKHDGDAPDCPVFGCKRYFDLIVKATGAE